MSAVVSRRLTITIQQSHDESIRAQLFTTFAAYGVMEAFVCEDSANYDQSIVTVQFQKLSASEQLQTDAVRSGREWHVLFQQATPQASAELLVSSRHPLDAALLTSLAKGQHPSAEGETGGKTGTAADAAPSVTSASRKPKGSSDFFEEKLLRAPGRSAKDDDGWASFTSRNVAVVQNHCVGPYAGLLRFKDAHSANAFLVANQQSLASQHDVYTQFIPPPPLPPQPHPHGHQQHGGRGSSGRAAPMPLHTAVHSLLSCQSLSRLAEGDTLRGFLVEARSTAVCVVDAGVVDDTADAQHHRPVLLVETHTNFLKSRLRDEVLVQLRAVDAPSRSVQATLLQTVNEDIGVAGNGRLLGSARHGDKNRHAHAHPQQLGVLPPQPFMSRIRGSHNNNSTQGSTPPSSQDSMTLSQPPLSQPPLPATKKLASRLFQSIQQRKAEGTLFTGGSTSLSAGSSGERISAFPPGLHPFSILLVRVDRVETGGSDPGLHATCLEQADGAKAAGGGGGSGSWPVFIPAPLIPSAEGEGWHSFAVAGERMTVALLYAVAVGDSRATLRCIASKLDADIRRATALAAAGSGAAVAPGELSQRQNTPLTLGADDGDGGEQTDSQQQRLACEGRRGSGGTSGGLAVGDTFSATPVRLLEAGDLGTSGTRGHFPSWVMLPREGGAAGLLCVLPQSHAPASLTAAAASMAAAGTGSALRALPPVDVVVSEVVHSSASGHYAVVMDASAFRAAEERKQEQLRREKEASREQVKRRLAAILGEDAVSGIHVGDPKAKKPREE